MNDARRKSEDYISDPADPQAYMSIRYGQYVQDIRNAYIAGAEMKEKEYIAEMRRAEEQLLLEYRSRGPREKESRRAIRGEDRCRDCKYFATVDYFGTPMQRPERVNLTRYASCPFRPGKSSNNTYPVLRAGEAPCEKFDRI